MTRLGEMLSTIGSLTHQLNVSMSLLVATLGDFSKVRR
jgi:hypothetical protein